MTICGRSDSKERSKRADIRLSFLEKADIETESLDSCCLMT